MIQQGPTDIIMIVILLILTEEYFRRTFRVSRNISTTILNELHPFLQDGSSRNSGQNILVSVELNLGIALYYMAHGRCGRHLRSASVFTASTARKYVYQVSKLICEKLENKHMGDDLLEKEATFRTAELDLKVEMVSRMLLGVLTIVTYSINPTLASLKQATRITSSGLLFCALRT